jgi:hypothetical protein
MARDLHRWLAGTDGPGKTALPLGEFLHPVPLGALLVLALNDHVLKGRGLLPTVLTGKLSDLAGLVFFPLLLTALADCVALGVSRATKRPLDFSLRRWKVLLALTVTAALFVPLKVPHALFAHYTQAYVDALGRLGFPSAVTRDPTDLFALVMLAAAWHLGMNEIRRVPLGRLEVLARGQASVQDGLADVRAARGHDPAVDRLADAYAAYLAAPTPELEGPVRAALAILRER